MIPVFTSEQDKLSFLKALPETADYRNMLRSDFGFMSQSNHTQKQMEKFWKFLVAKNKNPKDEAEVEQFYSQLYYVAPVQKKIRKEKYVPKHKNGGFKPGMTGEPSIKQADDQRYYGYLGDMMVVSSQSRKYVVSCFQKHGYEIE